MERIAILRWEKGNVPEGLMQLEAMRGNSTNLESYPFPVKMVYVDGASVETVITHPSQKLLVDMIELCKRLVSEEKIRAVTTSCGFNAIFQQGLVEALDVPVFTSALLQIPFVRSIIGKGRHIGVMTANKAALTEEHFRQCGVEDCSDIVVAGLETAEQWSKIFRNPDEQFNLETVEREIVGAAVEMVEQNPKIGAIVLECTDLPPYAALIRKTVGLPVFDYQSMMAHMAMALGELSTY